MRNIGPSLVVLLGMGFSSLAADAPPASPPPQNSELQQVRAELAALRLELAQTRLKLRQTQEQIEELGDFLGSPDPAAEMTAFRAQRLIVMERRQQLAEDLRKVELNQQTLREVQGVPAKPAPDPNRPDWDADYKMALIHTGLNSELIWVDPAQGQVLLERHPQVDRQHILIRGTFRNRSAAGWRYTFELRVADASGRLIGSWRYQTPLLDPGGLHPFEFKVPVTDVGYIQKYQIGNVEADRTAAPAAPPGGAANPPAPGPPVNPPAP